MTFRIGTPSAAERRKRRAAGFTLIELILVMALLVIVIAAVAPALSKFFRGRNLDSEARRLLSLTRLGQSRAVSEGTPMRLWIDAERRTYGLQAEQGGSTPDKSARIYQLDPDLAIEVVRNTRNRSGTTLRTTPGNAYDGSSLAVGLRFLADGTVDETSPDQIRLYQDPARRPEPAGTPRGQNEVWITTDTFRLRYEIATNLPVGYRP